jgi:hypothetical protein
VRASSSGGKVTLRRSDSCGYGYGLGPAVAGPLSGDAFLSESELQRRLPPLRAGQLLVEARWALAAA